MKNKSLCLISFLLTLAACTTASGAGSAYFKCDPSPVPIPTVTLTPAPGPTVTITPSPLPTPTVTVTTSPLPIPTVTVTVTPSPTLSPIPNPTVSVTPSPFPSPQPSAVLLRAMADEPANYTFTATLTESVPVITGLKIEAFEVMNLPATTISSAKEFAPGVYPEPVFPVARITSGLTYRLEVTPSIPGATSFFSLQGQAVEMRALNGRLPKNPSIPFYAEIQGEQILRAHGLQGVGVDVQGPMTVKYVNAARANRIEPIKQDILTEPAYANGVLNVDNWSTLGGSFRQLVLDNRIACPMVLRYIPGQMPAIPLLQAIEASIQNGTLPSCSWAYIGDEGQDVPAKVKEFKDRATLIQTWAPTLKRTITWRNSADTASGLFNTLIPNENLFTSASDYGSQVFGNYLSCMGNGNCANAASQAAVAPRTVYPVAVYDGPGNGIELRAFMNALDSQKAKVGLYYNLTQRLPTAWNAQGLYEQGGEGDGTLFFPGVKGMKGLTDHIPVTGLRMKQILAGSIDIEYRRMAKAAGISYTNPAPSYTVYSRQEADYEAMREVIRKALFPAAYP